jgi:hypothetical protein
LEQFGFRGFCAAAEFLQGGYGQSRTVIDLGAACTTNGIPRHFPDQPRQERNLEHRLAAVEYRKLSR